MPQAASASSAARVADVTSPEIGRTIDVDGLATNVHILGDPATQPAVLLIHGSGPGVTAYANWRLTMPALGEHFAVVAPDVLGFGFTERPDGVRYDLPTWTAHAVGVLDALGIDRAHVVGNSFGGALALSLAINHPQRVQRLVLMGAAGGPMRLSEGLDRVWGYEPSIEAMQSLLELFAYDPGLVGTDLARLRYEASIRPGVQEAFAAMFPPPRQQALDAITHPVDRLALITHPTLIVHGREDRVIPLESSLALLSLIDDARLHVFGRCGHWTQIEHADAFNRLLIEFFHERMPRT